MITFQNMQTGGYVQSADSLRSNDPATVQELSEAMVWHESDEKHLRMVHPSLRAFRTVGYSRNAAVPKAVPLLTYADIDQAIALLSATPAGVQALASVLNLSAVWARESPSTAQVQAVLRIAGFIGYHNAGGGSVVSARAAQQAVIKALASGGAK